MPTSLRHNLTSAYLDAARKLSPKRARRRIVAYVESYDDIAFWRTLLEEFEDDEHYFQVMLSGVPFWLSSRMRSVISR